MSFAYDQYCRVKEFTLICLSKLLPVHKLPLDIQLYFFRFLNNEITVADFEQWVKECKHLPDALDPHVYEELTLLNFNSSNCKSNLRAFLATHFSLGEYERYKLKALLQSLVVRSPGLINALIHTYNLYCDGYGFLDNLGLGYGLPLSQQFCDINEWKKLSHTKQQKLIEAIFPPVRDEALKLLKLINKHKIVFTGEIDDSGYYGYIDHRTPHEIALASFNSSKCTDKLRVGLEWLSNLFEE
jgi:hypothetical protein